MSNNRSRDEISQCDLEIELPKILKGPILLDDGTTLSVGDRIAHTKYGIGTVLRLFTYDAVGPGVYVDFGNNVEKQLAVSYIKKLPGL